VYKVGWHVEYNDEPARIDAIDNRLVQGQHILFRQQEKLLWLANEVLLFCLFLVCSEDYVISPQRGDDNDTNVVHHLMG
jgi:hypothetical protein